MWWVLRLGFEALGLGLAHSIYVQVFLGVSGLARGCFFGLSPIRIFFLLYIFTPPPPST